MTESFVIASAVCLCIYFVFCPNTFFVYLIPDLGDFFCREVLSGKLKEVYLSLESVFVHLMRRSVEISWNISNLILCCCAS